MSDATGEAEKEENDPLDLVFDRRSFRLVRIHLKNFLSYKELDLQLDHITALIGPNASGKSNAIAGLKLLRDIAEYGLPIALARRGGFDQLRHRSAGRPYDPSIRLDFQVGPDERLSHYELNLGAVKGGKYRIKSESGEVCFGNRASSFSQANSKVEWIDPYTEDKTETRSFPVPEGQSAVSLGSLAGWAIYQLLRSIQIIEVNPASVKELQEPSSTREFAPDGSNAASIFESLTTEERTRVVEYLAAIVPGIAAIEPLRVADKQTLRFKQVTSGGNREFSAKQMSDGTLRAFVILLAALRDAETRLLVIEEPEVAIHIGALRSLVDILTARSERIQVLMTTHSDAIVDELPLESLRVVWSEDGISQAARVSAATREILKEGLITPGELLRADSLDPER